MSSDIAFRIVGTITVHELGNLRIDFSGCPSWIELETDLQISDREYEIAATLIARELDLTVYWQDLVGRNRWASPKDEPLRSLGFSLDPRFEASPAHSQIN